MEVEEAIEAQGDDNLKEKFRAAVACVQRTIDLYGSEGVAFSFNGGKDSTVLLHILRAAVARSKPEAANADLGLEGICTFIFEREDDFPEILEFVRDVNREFRLHVEELRGDFRSGLEDLLSRRPIKAVLIGTRRGDPNAAGQNVFCPSSAGWPPFMRVNPILEWSYSDVWAFLRAAGVQYCCLYDRGFTSVGSIDSTTPNSSLRKEDGSYAPAYMLADSRMERAGRVSNSTPKAGDMSAFTRSAAVIIIGDEILSGKVEDSNARFLSKELFSLGWRLAKIVTIPDEVGVIANEVHAASESYDLVITTGGVGPTVDDVTMAGVARALGYSVTRDVSLEQRLRDYFGEHITDAHLKLAEAPSGEVSFVEIQLENGEASPFPVVRCRNIYILPGIPSLLQHKWKVVKEQLKEGCTLPRFHTIQLRLGTTDETQVAPALQEVSSTLGSSVSVGSYPVTNQSDGAGVVLSLESKDWVTLNVARDKLLERIPDLVVVSEERDSQELSKNSH